MMALAPMIGQIEPYAIRDRSHLLDVFRHKVHWSNFFAWGWIRRSERYLN
jgi:hypothetical protein